MNSALLVTLLIVATAITTVLLFIRRYPLRVREHWVECPAKEKPLMVGFIRKEMGFGNFRVADVASCSLFPDGNITCGKECIGRFPLI